MMLGLFRRRHRAGSESPGAKGASADQCRFQSPLLPEALLGSPRRQQLLENIWQRTSLSPAHFLKLYREPLERYAALVQLFPASESHHHAYAGGLLDHGLEIVAYVLKFRQSHLLPIGASTETQAAQAEAWTAAAAYAALLHDIGKIAVDLHVEFPDGSCWHPWHGPIQQPYRFRFRSDRNYRLHPAAAGLVYNTILSRYILDWLCEFPELWANLLNVLAGRPEHAGILGDLVQKADQASVAHDMGGDPAKAGKAPKTSLQRKLIDGLRFLVREELRINQPQGSDGWLSSDALWLVSKTVCDKLRAHLLSQGTEGVPQSNASVFDILQEHGIAQPTPAGRAIWKATVTSSTGWTHSFTFLRISPALIWDSDTRPSPFQGAVTVDPEGSTTEVNTVDDRDRPSSSPDTATSITRAEVPAQAVNPYIDIGAQREDLIVETDEAAAYSFEPVASSNASINVHEPIAPAPEHHASAGAVFREWLREAIASRKLKINEPDALVHTVDGTAFLVSPGIFRRFIAEHPRYATPKLSSRASDWEALQKEFERTRSHRKQHDGRNIWTCEVRGARRTRRLHGYLLLDGTELLPTLPPDNRHLSLILHAAPSKDD